MIRFNRLELDAESKYLTIDIEVDRLMNFDGTQDFYEDIYIDRIYMDTEKTFNQRQMPSAKVVKIWDSQELDQPECKHLETVALEMEVPVEIAFIYVITKGKVKQGAPCSVKNSPDIGVAYNKCKLLKYNVGLLDKLGDPCEVNNQFVNELLRLKAFEISMRTGNFDQAIRYWDSFFNPKKGIKTNCAYSGNAGVVQVKSCGCHG